MLTKGKKALVKKKGRIKKKIRKIFEMVDREK